MNLEDFPSPHHAIPRIKPSPPLRRVWRKRSCSRPRGYVRNVRQKPPPRLSHHHHLNVIRLTVLLLVVIIIIIPTNQNCIVSAVTMTFHHFIHHHHSDRDDQNDNPLQHHSTPRRIPFKPLGKWHKLTSLTTTMMMMMMTTKSMDTEEMTLPIRRKTSILTVWTDRHRHH